MDEGGSAAFRERLSEIRHDLRTPVGHIMGYSEMIEEDLEDESWPEFTEDLKKIRSSGEKLLELITDLLGPSKESAEDIDIPSTQFQLRLQLNHISGYCEMLHELIEDEGREDLEPDLDKIGEAANTFVRILDEKLTESSLAVGPQAVVVEAPEPQTTTQPPVRPREQGAERADLDVQSPDGWLGTGGDILIVDDDAANRDLLRRRLERQGFLAVAVEGGRAALEYLAVERVDLILLDVKMPDMNGIEVLEVLKKDSVLRNIPVIMISALDNMDQIIQCILLGAEDYLFKPFNPVLLRARIGASLEKVRLRKQQAKRWTVFVSSPGDVIPERRIVKSVLNQLNDEYSGQVFLKPIFWEEEPLLASETFQSQIQSSGEVDFYVGIFWSRLGSKLPEHIRRPDGSRYLSGSEFEFEEAMAGYQERGRPEILVYRKSAEPMIPLPKTARALSLPSTCSTARSASRRWCWGTFASWCRSGWNLRLRRFGLVD
jgi:CheY-like chemotaxis protein